MTTIINGSSPSITFSDATTQTTAFTSTPSVTTITTSGQATFATSSGNVGIGTSSPAQKLDVQAAACIAKFTSTTGTNSVYTQMVNTGGSFYLGTDDSTGATSGAAYGRFVYGTGAYPMLFFTNSAERMRIDSSGAVGIGTTNPATNNGGALTVVTSSTNAAQFIVNANSYPIVCSQNGSSSGLVYFNYNNGNVGTITTNGTITLYNTSSDYRLKENVAPMTGALDTVAKLKPVTYTWKANGSNGQGFIAHELAEIVPNCVTGKKDAMRVEKYEISPAIPAEIDEDGKVIKEAVEAVMGEKEVPNFQGIDTSYLVSTLTAAIQEQQAMIETLTARLTALESK